MRILENRLIEIWKNWNIEKSVNQYMWTIGECKNLKIVNSKNRMKWTENRKSSNQKIENSKIRKN